MAESNIDTQFRNWWNANWRKLPESHRKQALAYYKAKKEEQAYNEQKRAQEKAQSQGNISGVVGAIGAPVAYAAGNKLAGILGLGQQGGTAAAQTVGNVGANLGGSIGTTAGSTAGTTLGSTGANLAGSTLPSAAGQSSGGLLSLGGSSGPALGPAGDAAGVGLESAPTSISNFAGAATPYLGAAGTALGAYSALQGVKKKDPLAAGLGGAGAAAGLNMMGMALGPYGWAAMLAAPAIGALINKMGDKDRFKDEWKRAGKLQKAGIQWGSGPGAEPEAGRSIDQLVAIEQAKINQGQYGNTKFAQSRDERDLTALDTVGYSLHPELLGKAYVDASMDQRIKFNEELLKQGLIDEHHGTMDYKNKDAAKSIWDQVMQGLAIGAPTAPQPGMTPGAMPGTPQVAPPLVQGTPGQPAMATGGVVPDTRFLYDYLKNRQA